MRDAEKGWALLETVISESWMEVDGVVRCLEVSGNNSGW